MLKLDLTSAACGVTLLRRSCAMEPMRMLAWRLTPQRAAKVRDRAMTMVVRLISVESLQGKIS